MSSLKLAGIVRGPSATPFEVHAPTGRRSVTLPCRDIAEAKRFLVEVLGVTEIAVVQQDDGWTEPADRYPHVLFEADLPDALALRERLSRCGVPTALASAGADGVLYFRDPAGYLWKIVSRDAGTALRATTACADDEQVDVGTLSYAGWSAAASVDVP